MKNYWRKAFCALVLWLMVTTPVFAGDGFMHTDKTTPQPPTTNSAIGGLIHISAADALREIGLSLLQGLLTRF